MTTAPRIIGVSGFLRTGKDAVAKLLAQFGYEKVSFAGPLRKVAYDIDAFMSLEGAPADVIAALGFLPAGSGSVQYARYSDLIDTLGYEVAKSIPDVRRHLQRVGTEGIRGNFGDSAWVDLAKKTIEELGPDAKIVIPDTRFPNEAQAVRDLGGVVWRTERPGFNGGPHPSEAEVLNITPDVILRASTLLDDDDNIGLGTLVLNQLGLDPANYLYLLQEWADAETSTERATVSA